MIFSPRLTPSPPFTLTTRKNASIPCAAPKNRTSPTRKSGHERMGKAGSIAALRPTVPTTAAKTFFGTNFGQFPAIFGTKFGLWCEFRADFWIFESEFWEMLHNVLNSSGDFVPL